MDAQEIKSLFERLKDASRNPEEVARLCEKYLSDSTPNYNLDIMGASIEPYNIMPFLKNREVGVPIIKQLASGLTAMLLERGYRNNIETHQEHRLFGSSGSGVNPTSKEFPYTVGAILNNEISVEEARQARKLNYIMSVNSAHWGLDGEFFMLLPEIDDNGVTIRDPVLVDKSGKVIAEELVDGAPYKRN